MEFETPAQLLGRLKLGREEYCQRLLTTLILHAPYPPWNTRMTPAPEGMRFLHTLYARSFGDPWPGDHALFVDEFELRPRHEAERGGAPDYAVIWHNRLWLIELKTERASHRARQIPGYFELAHHHFPKASIDLLYVTPPMAALYSPDATWARYAHTTWSELVEPIRIHWPTGTTPGQQRVIDGLLEAIGNLDTDAATWRTTVRPTSRVPNQETSASDEVPDDAVLVRALDTARLVAEDGRQRAMEFVGEDLEDLLSLRLAVRNALAATSADSPLRRVVPWIWRHQSAGKPLTRSGLEHGMELRLSRYSRARY